MRNNLIYCLFLSCVSSSFVMAAEPGEEKVKTSLPFTASTEVAFDRSGQHVTHRIESDGSLSADHNGSLQNVIMARVGPNGEIERFCTTNKEAAIAFLNEEPPREFVAPAYKVK